VTRSGSEPLPDGLVPQGLTETMRGRPQDEGADGSGSGPDDGDSWLRRLPSLVADGLRRWDLTVDGAPRHGQCALVLPVRRAAGEQAALKITWPHHEARTEHLALRHWAGAGAVRLLAADPTSWTMLLERLHADRDLSTEPIDDACAAIGGLLAQLASPAIPAVPRLSAYAERQAVELQDAPAAIPRRLAGQARSLAWDLAMDDGVDAQLLHTDLHYSNVLAGGRAPWLAIDPKPMAGEAAYEVAPALWNRWDEAVASGDVRAHLRRRLAVICESAGIDPDRARSWTIVREVDNAVDAAQDGDMERVTATVTVVKAMSG